MALLSANVCVWSGGLSVSRETDVSRDTRCSRVCPCHVTQFVPRAIDNLCAQGCGCGLAFPAELYSATELTKGYECGPSYRDRQPEGRGR